jgi:hypothetical protein
MNIHAIDEIKDVAADSRPVLAVRLGRGRTGGTTFMDFLIQRARRNGKTVRVADGDRLHSTLSGFYPPGEPGGALRPQSTEIGDVAEWVTEVVSQAAADQVSMVLDMGAGDSVLEQHAKQMSLSEFCEASGIALLAVYTVGTAKDDFNDAMTVYEKGYARCDRTLFVMNESLIENGKGAAGAFDFVMDDARYQAIEHKVRTVRMPNLACMKAMRDENLSAYEAVEGERGASGRPMSLGHQFTVKTWINRMEQRLSSVEDWLL